MTQSGWRDFFGLPEPKNYMDRFKYQTMSHDRFLYTTAENEAEAEDLLKNNGIRYHKQDSNTVGVTEYIFAITSQQYNRLASLISNSQFMRLTTEREGNFGYVGDTQIGFTNVLGSYNIVSGSPTIYDTYANLYDGLTDTKIGINCPHSYTEEANMTVTMDLTRKISAKDYKYSLTFEQRWAAGFPSDSNTTLYFQMYNISTLTWDTIYSSINVTKSFGTVTNNLPTTEVIFSKARILLNNKSYSTDNNWVYAYELAISKKF